MDPKTGLKSTAVLITYFVELMRESFEMVKITRRIAEPGCEASKVPLGVEKGKCYAFEIQSVEWKPGFLLARLGAVEPAELDLSEPAPRRLQRAPGARPLISCL